ncbi:alpha/beta fold hydrolase [Sphingomonas montana]|uniref:alpha/beta fold hydrolase n=1 Tax=Sphingomonas montana TaxID=1843236 RepID=UPI00096C31CA|nr:alpha/beta fold hydrolase [Sphingomonas montana]
MVTTHEFIAPDGVRLAWHEVGEGRPIMLIHGLFSSADTNWIKFGHAKRIAALGQRVIMPDLRAHGESDRPHDAAAYPPDVLADDAEALIAHLGLTDYDLGGYSLGARTVVRMLVRGAAPDRVILSGMGLDGLLDTGHRAAHFRRILTGLGTFERGTPEWMAEAFLKTSGGDPKALLPLLGSFVDTTRVEIAAIDRPVLVVSGAEDDDNGSSAALAELLPHGAYVAVPGNHMSAVVKPELGRAMVEWLGVV